MTAYPQILILGTGAWGTALALVIARNHHRVWLWGRDAQFLETMARTRVNARYLPDYTFPDTLELAPPQLLAKIVSQVQDILIVVPSHAFRQTLQNIVPYFTAKTRLCWATKGFELETGLLLHEVAKQVVGIQHPLAVLSGPSFAKEVADQCPTAVTIASAEATYANELVELFHHSHFRPYLSSDMIGVQVGGAVKNVMAIAAGMADGLNLGANAQAALITRGLAEMVRFGTALGGQIETFMGLAGLGDLVLTCTDDQSRNRRFGLALAKGYNKHEAQNEIGAVIEGINATAVVHQLARQQEIDMPIVAQVNKVLAGELSPTEAVQALLSRTPKRESFSNY
jgi:glycerol-3-phosphate dehydrogenase (NAD(P)+)